MKQTLSQWSCVRLFVAGTWAVFVVSLVAWWIYFGIEQVDRLRALNVAEDDTVIRYQKMLLWEGMAMVASLLAGAIALFYYIIRENREARRLREFFAAFTHDIKTPLASARLKSEILRERLSDSQHVELVEKVLADVGRLSLQLENSLFLADKRSGAPFIEEVAIGSVIDGLRDLWPQLDIQCDTNATVQADRRILDTVFANILQNAAIHGQTNRVEVEVQNTSGQCTIVVRDRGQGFRGDRGRLGVLFERHYPRSGSGLGLYLVRMLIRRLGGVVHFPESENGFAVEMTLPT